MTERNDQDIMEYKVFVRDTQSWDPGWEKRYRGQWLAVIQGTPMVINENLDDLRELVEGANLDVAASYVQIGGAQTANNE